ncbi:MAG: hypothetical protein AAAC48_02135 [Phyllobacterium sp.]|uniref:hypothetical protein n=1 Tax=Phyllobacterium sp. TaxID=1871046 RepID=UPI0030F21B1B
MPDAAEIDHHLRRALMSVLCGKLLAVLSFGHHIESIIVTDHPSLKSAAVDFVPGGFASLSFDERDFAEFCGYIAGARLSGSGLKPSDFPDAERLAFARAEKILARFGDAKMELLIGKLCGMRQHGTHALRSLTS